eukprot:CAMPEP_0119278910 /NCGR_PEP_ID=MMETSP1329-20130426/19910_1 /TAXON_ID=114041 /ORGANISM="Genus nov. species nov., Strain RCC1024" /LENGTH=145 /DNA_ID=CAMNT_0007279439 /DNA_START=131 /DNA_END=565 /DNA_ORIENTATION=-
MARLSFVALLALLGAAVALRQPATPRRLKPLRAAAAALPAPSVGLGWLRRAPGDVAWRLTPGLAHWTSAHLLSSPSQKILAGVSADQKAADRITVVGGLVNVFLTLAKLAAGILGNSAAMISDAAHSASDLASDVVTLVAMRASR